MSAANNRITLAEVTAAYAALEKVKPATGRFYTIMQINGRFIQCACPVGALYLVYLIKHGQPAPFPVGPLPEVVTWGNEQYGEEYFVGFLLGFDLCSTSHSYHREKPRFIEGCADGRDCRAGTKVVS